MNISGTGMTTLERCLIAEDTLSDGRKRENKAGDPVECNFRVIRVFI